MDGLLPIILVIVVSILVSVGKAKTRGANSGKAQGSGMTKEQLEAARRAAQVREAERAQAQSPGSLEEQRRRQQLAAERAQAAKRAEEARRRAAAQRNTTPARQPGFAEGETAMPRVAAAPSMNTGIGTSTRTLSTSQEAGHAHRETSISGFEDCPPAKHESADIHEGIHSPRKVEKPQFAFSGSDVVRAVIYSEILGKPKSQRREAQRQ